MKKSPFPRDQHLTAIAIAYRNPDVELIADSILPRVPVGNREFKWFEYDLASHYTIPNTRVGRLSKVNRVEIQGEERTAACEDFGIDIPLSNDDIRNAPKGVDPRDRAVSRATDIVLLDREVRTAQLVFNADLYPDSNKETLSGSSQFTHADSNPLKTLHDSLDKCLVRPNVVVFGQAAWSAFSMHAKVVAAGHGNSGTSGKVSRERAAELLEVSEVLVGRSYLNIAKPGLTPVFERVWGPHVLAFYRDRTADVSGGLTFGLTAVWGDRVAGSKEEDIGLHGGVMVRSGESVKELVVAKHAAFFLEDAAA